MLRTPPFSLPENAQSLTVSCSTGTGLTSSGVTPQSIFKSNITKPDRLAALVEGRQLEAVQDDG